jgi:PAS domain S-box-containing protein
MNSSKDPLHTRARALAFAASLIAMIVSVAVLSGWTPRIPWLTRLFSGFITMKPVTALCFFLSGFSLSLLAPESSLTVARRRLAQVSAFLVTIVGIATTIEFATGFNLGFEGVLSRLALYATGVPNAARLSLPSALAFIFLGIALVLLDLETSRGARPAPLLAIGVLFFALVNVLAYLYSADDLNRVPRLDSMATHTAVLLLLLGLGAIAARPDRGPLAVFFGSGIASPMARRVLVAAILLTVATGWIQLIGERRGLYGGGFGLALLASANIAMFSALIAFSARSVAASLDKLDAANRDLVAATKELADDELRQHAILLDLAPILIRDLDNRIILWTRGAQQLYGYSKEQAIGRFAHELLQTQFPVPAQQIADALERSGTWEGQLQHRTSDGRTVFVASHRVLHRDASGKPARILEVSSDLTELKRVQTLQMRSQKLESLGTLAGGVAHDFNNILLAINGNAKLALEDLPSGHPASQNLSEIAKAGARAADLVRRILAFSRPQDQEKKPQPVQPVVEEALELVRATLPASVHIECSFSPDLPLVALDSTQLHQVIVNLATNASHAIGDKHGTITLRLDGRTFSAADLLAVPDVHEGRYVCLTVSDDGCGMDRATLDRVFDPFFTTKSVGQGTGLGLSVVHGIVTSHGGVITAYSQPGYGTSFVLHFPAVETSTHATAPIQAPAPPVERGRHENILYVDDEEGLVMLGTLFRNAWGMRSPATSRPPRHSTISAHAPTISPRSSPTFPCRACPALISRANYLLSVPLSPSS